MTAPLRTIIDERPMTRFQWTTVAVCVLLNTLDGFDVLVMAFTGRAVSSEWGLNGAELGLLLSAGLVGMGLGAMFVAPWADRLGRRPVTLACLALVAAGMLLSAASQSAGQLGALRIVTGVGIGGILATSSVISAEYASPRWRGLAVSLNSTGYALGATVGGLLAVLLIGQFGWRSVFLAGGVLTAAAILLVGRRLPESLDFLLTRQPARALERTNAILARMGAASLSALPPRASTPRGVGSGYRDLLATGLRRNTLLLWGAFFCVLASFYFVTSWTPTLLTEAGLSATGGLTGGTLLNLGGIFGAALLGLLAARFSLRSVVAAYLVASGVLLAVFITTTSSLVAALAVAVVIGMLVNGCVAGLNSLTPAVYDPAVRTTGLGTGLAIGRIGAILAPTAAGSLLDAGWTASHLYLTAGGVLAAASLLILALRMSLGTHSAGTLTRAAATPPETAAP